MEMEPRMPERASWAVSGMMMARADGAAMCLEA